MPRCCIAAQNVSSGVSVWRAFAQAVRHLYLVANTRWTEGARARPPCVCFMHEMARVESPKKRGRSESEVPSGLFSGVDLREQEGRSSNDGWRTCGTELRDEARSGNDGSMDRLCLIS